MAMMLLVGMSAATAKADDPTIMTHDPVCTPGPGDPGFSGGTLNITLDADDGYASNFCYTGTTPLEELVLTFDAPAGILFNFTGGQGAGNPFPDIPSYSPLSSSAVDFGYPCNMTTCTLLYTVDFFGPPGIPASVDGVDYGVGVTETAPDPSELLDLSINVSVVEPSTILLLLAGLIPMIWFGRKFRGAAQSV